MKNSTAVHSHRSTKRPAQVSRKAEIDKVFALSRAERDKNERAFITAIYNSTKDGDRLLEIKKLLKGCSKKEVKQANQNPKYAQLRATWQESQGVAIEALLGLIGKPIEFDMLVTFLYLASRVCRETERHCLRAFEDRSASEELNQAEGVC